MPLKHGNFLNLFMLSHCVDLRNNILNKNQKPKPKKIKISKSLSIRKKKKNLFNDLTWQLT